MEEQQEQQPVSLSSQQPVSLSSQYSLSTQMESTQVSASFPRSYQKTDTTRLTSVVTARPFGSHSRGITSLPRFYTLDDSWKYNGDIDSSKRMQISSGTMTRTLDPVPLATSLSSVQETTVESVTQGPSPTSSLASLSQDQPATSKATLSSMSGLDSMSESGEGPGSPQREVSKSQDQFSDMRISINQTPGNAFDFGFTVRWDFSSIFVASVEPDSAAEFSQLQVDDEIIAVNNTKFSYKDKKEWEETMANAQETGNLVMDIRRYGKSGSPETKWIDATSGVYSSDKSSSLSITTEFSESLRGSNIQSKEVNGICDESNSFETKASEPISLKNLKRRSQFFEQGSTDSVVPDLPIPTISAPSRWAWDQDGDAFIYRVYRFSWNRSMFTQTSNSASFCRLLCSDFAMEASVPENVYSENSKPWADAKKCESSFKEIVRGRSGIRYNSQVIEEKKQVNQVDKVMKARQIPAATPHGVTVSLILSLQPRDEQNPCIEEDIFGSRKTSRTSGSSHCVNHCGSSGDTMEDFQASAAAR
ncbi:LOW QUALITY PROTEIN: LIM domain only protein 7-like [Sorex fumeus]|uniref:LOW QUALITY PROTEIN: LIM domain only protein 7-like n=1 Tax=Sorex fumeus TaxID=62283 RepID=UPI0024AC9F56|nr:LOW QUALITY PROTEIN: LIM domain only protein 7-like [Sorex fumeus]